MGTWTKPTETLPPLDHPRCPIAECNTELTYLGESATMTGFARDQIDTNRHTESFLCSTCKRLYRRQWGWKAEDNQWVINEAKKRGLI